MSITGIGLSAGGTGGGVEQYPTGTINFQIHGAGFDSPTTVGIAVTCVGGFAGAMNISSKENLTIPSGSSVATTTMDNVLMPEAGSYAYVMPDAGWLIQVISGNAEQYGSGVKVYGNCTLDVSRKANYKSKLAQIVEGSVTELTEADLSGISRIKPSAFYFLSHLTSITIPSSVTSIGYNAFYECTGLTSITIPSGVTLIADYCFYDCSSLTSITIPSGITEIGKNAFSGCTRLTSITIPNGVTSIADYCFYECSGITSITIPSGVTSIGLYAFGKCSGLTSIIIPSGVTSIGNRAFSSCANLERITVEAVSPPHLGNANAFEGTSANLIIYVPDESVDAYKAAVSWSDYADRIQAIPEA